ncbi:hypothetical protein C8F04DRAFT_1265066 [Mycena alexandri]|uniref:Uncharacterized protein n=1 Tax=Mycena alexandri TaxID=1745969 RepID=A0AAD6SKU3_9AGAR|nr:hypothetical protein C8F04DRAFT_1265066 [Mycena alexandri]
MTRTIQTALATFPDLLAQNTVALEIWPDLREAHDAVCNQVKSGDYEVHSAEAATCRAKRVRAALAERTERNILLRQHDLSREDDGVVDAVGAVVHYTCWIFGHTREYALGWAVREGGCKLGVEAREVRLKGAKDV